MSVAASEAEKKAANVAKRRIALGLDFGTESVRALAVDCETGQEAAQAIVPYAHGVITSRLPGSADALSNLPPDLPPDFALQHAGDYLASVTSAVQTVLKTVSASDVVGIGVDFTACTILPVKRDGTPLMLLPEFAWDPHAWVKLWKHHAAQPQADEVNRVARERGEAFQQYYSSQVSSEWMLPKAWEIAEKSPAVYAAADLIVDAGDWIVQQMTGTFTRNSCAAGYKGLWNAELGFPSEEFLGALSSKIAGLRDKWLMNIVAPGSRAGTLSESFARLTGLEPGTPVSAATIDAHSGVAGMGVYREGALSIIMGTSSCHMALSRELKLFDGYAGVVKDGIIPGFHGYESGQAAVGDIFGWFAKGFMNRSFRELSLGAGLLKAGESGLVALDWHNGNRSTLMSSDLTGMILGLTLTTRPEEVYRALIEATAYGSRLIVETHQKAGVPIQELVVCGGLTQDPLILQIYADVCGLPVRVAASQQAVALGAAIFGALAAGTGGGGFDDCESAIARMTQPATRTYEPSPDAHATYDRLYGTYLAARDFFGIQRPDLMKQLKRETHA